MSSLFRRRASGSVAALAIFAMLAVPAQAQFGGLIPREARNVASDATSTDGGCKQGENKSAGGRVLGGILGRAARDAASRTGLSQFVPVAEFTDQISNEIACRLDPEEQKQAAEATLKATRSLVPEGEEDPGVDTRPAIGSSSSWQSETRDDVRGTSTVVARDTPEGSELDCITVTDVVIVSGEETKADKRMCRAPGSRRYSIVA